MTSTLHALDHTGDTEIKWDPDRRDEVDAARATFDRLVKHSKYLAYEVKPGDKREQIREFNPRARRIVLTPQLVGG